MTGIYILMGTERGVYYVNPVVSIEYIHQYWYMNALKQKQDIFRANGSVVI